MLQKALQDRFSVSKNAPVPKTLFRRSLIPAFGACKTPFYEKVLFCPIEHTIKMDLGNFFKGRVHCWFIASLIAELLLLEELGDGIASRTASRHRLQGFRAQKREAVSLAIARRGFWRVACRHPHHSSYDPCAQTSRICEPRTVTISELQSRFLEARNFCGLSRIAWSFQRVPQPLHLEPLAFSSLLQTSRYWRQRCGAHCTRQTFCNLLPRQLLA